MEDKENNEEIMKQIAENARKALDIINQNKKKEDKEGEER